MIEINLLGEKGKEKKKASLGPTQFDAFRPFLVPMILSVIVLYTPHYILEETIAEKKAQLQEEIKVADAELTKNKAREKELSAVITKVDSLRNQQAEIQIKIASVERVVSTRLYPVPVLDGISQIIPKFVWLTEMEYKNSQSPALIILQGNALTNEILSDFLAGLQESTLFTNIRLEESLHKEEKDIAFKQFKIALTAQESI